MVVFWLSAAAMIGVALLFVVPPILGRRRKDRLTRQEFNLAVYRDQLSELEAEREDHKLSDTQYRQNRSDLERALLSDVDQQENTTAPTPSRRRIAAAIIGLAVPITAVTIYWLIGSQESLRENTVASAKSPLDSQVGAQPPSMEEVVELLVARLEQDPGNPQDWFMLGRAYVALERLPEAKNAYAQAHAQAPNNPEILIDYAELLARVNGNNLSGEPTALIQRALELDSNLPKALWLAGIAAFQRGDNPEAVEAWKRLLDLQETSAEQRQVLEQFIAQAQGEPSTPAVSPPSTQVAESPAGPSLSVRVSLDPTLESQAQPADTVFIFARAAEGPRMPLAIVRKHVRDLPVTVTLDDSMSMVPNISLSSFPEVIVGARVSKSGNASPSSGDLQGHSGKIRIDAVPDVEVTIADTVP